MNQSEALLGRPQGGHVDCPPNRMKEREELRNISKWKPMTADYDRPRNNTRGTKKIRTINNQKFMMRFAKVQTSRKRSNPRIYGDIACYCQKFWTQFANVTGNRASFICCQCLRRKWGLKSENGMASRGLLPTTLQKISTSLATCFHNNKLWSLQAKTRVSLLSSIVYVNGKFQYISSFFPFFLI